MTPITINVLSLCSTETISGEVGIMTINNLSVEEEFINTQTLPQKLQNEKWGFWGTLIWAVVIWAFMAGSQLLTIQIIYGGITTEILNKVRNDGNALHLLFFVTLVMLALILCGIIKLKKNSNIKEYLAINRISLRQIKIWGIVAFIFIIAEPLKAYVLGIPQIVMYQHYINIYNSTSQFWLFFFTLAITGPLIEELMFRGFLFSGFSSSFLGPAGAIIVTSLIWAALHYFSGGLFHMFYMIIPGLVAGTARYKTNSLFTPLMIHSLVNLGEAVKIAYYAS